LVGNAVGVAGWGSLVGVAEGRVATAGKGEGIAVAARRDRAGSGRCDKMPAKTAANAAKVRRSLMPSQGQIR
jgi:hypothetical protein